MMTRTMKMIRMVTIRGGELAKRDLGTATQDPQLPGGGFLLLVFAEVNGVPTRCSDQHRGGGPLQETWRGPFSIVYFTTPTLTLPLEGEMSEPVLSLVEVMGGEYRRLKTALKLLNLNLEFG